VAEPMAVWDEVWPVALDGSGVWLLDDPRDQEMQVFSDDEPQAVAETRLHLLGMLDHLIALHSTSWRVDGQRLITSWIAVIAVPTDYVRQVYPKAMPLSTSVLDLVGHPIPHGATEPPTPRDLDVLLHALRHLAFLVGPEGDVNVRDALTAAWLRELGPVRHALAGMYQRRVA
jgi:hypothetical protein